MKNLLSKILLLFTLITGSTFTTLAQTWPLVGTQFGAIPSNPTTVEYYSPALAYH